MNAQDKLKNIKDLEYGRWLNLENLLFALIGGAVVTVLLTQPEELPTNLTKSQIIFPLLLSIFLVATFIDIKLRQITDAIKRL